MTNKLDRNIDTAHKMLNLEFNKEKEWTNIKSGKKYEVLLLGNTTADANHKDTHPVRVAYKAVDIDDIWIVDLDYFLARFE